MVAVFFLERLKKRKRFLWFVFAGAALSFFPLNFLLPSEFWVAVIYTQKLGFVFDGKGKKLTSIFFFVKGSGLNGKEDTVLSLCCSVLCRCCRLF
ncbi:unnamed protein product [Trifolium pratense]|uniref:Uncharacterized protein n=1 Tax=Trifolium pratense TaxID=57577 RepID=A0ACB0KD46_TRIPR|nr:unnamed protein product [Trifolium pratense]